MKKTLLLLSLGGAFALPAITHADTPTAKTERSATALAAQTPMRNKHVIYYITDTPRTGSLIPMVYRRYDGRIDSASAAAVYGQSDIGRTGALDVSTALTKVDPSITSRGRR